MDCGLIGAKLGHSFSPLIHSRLADYDYQLVELPDEADARAFFARRDFRGVNVTIPYKKLALEACDEVDPSAAAIGAVNTVVNRGGRLVGYNTDYDGFAYTARRRGISFRDRVVLVLGTGGTSGTVAAVARAAGAKQVLFASRTGKNGALTYEQAAGRADVDLIVNASPAGMYPDTTACLADPGRYPRLAGVLDVIYNPLHTALLQRAEALGVPCSNGLPMLVAQAKYAAERFTQSPIPDARIEDIYREVKADRANLVLVGMPSCGKSSLGKACAKSLGKPYVDLDEQLEQRAGRPIGDILRPGDEKPFRDLESQVTADFAKEGGQVLSTGGGVVLRPENVAALRQNGVVVFVDRPLADLVPGGGRPLSQTREALAAQYAARLPLYQAACHARVENTGEFYAVAKAIQEAFYEVLRSERA